MVLLTITEDTLNVIQFCRRDDVEGWPLDTAADELDLEHADLGDPIKHHQVIELSRIIREFRMSAAKDSRDLASVPEGSLQSMLRQSKVYKEPPKPKVEPSSEYKTLMRKLREQEEAASYERMVAASQTGAIYQGNSRHQAPHIFSGYDRHATPQDDDLTFADVNRQLALIMNVLLSIIACSVAIWMAARHLNTPLRLSLSMGGSGIVGVAEVVVYAGYLRRIKEAKQNETKKQEVKEVMETWVIERDNSSTAPEKLVKSVRTTKQADDHVRKRKPVVRNDG